MQNGYEFVINYILLSLLTNLKNLNCDNYFMAIKKSRNQSTHRRLINVLFHHNTGTGKNDEHQVFFVLDLDKNLEVIPFMEASLQKVKDLIQDIMIL